MLITRLSSVLITALLVAAALYDAEDPRDFMLYYSHWSLILLLFMFISAAATSMQVAKLKHCNRYHVPRHVMVHRLLYTVACTANLVSSIVYVLITFSYSNNTKKPVNHVVHSFNSLLVLVEVVLNAIPLRLYHVYLPMLYTLMYAVFAAVYHHYTGREIYKCLQWDNQQEVSRLCIGFFIIMIAIYMVLYTVSFVKIKCLRLL